MNEEKKQNRSSREEMVHGLTFWDYYQVVKAEDFPCSLVTVNHQLDSVHPFLLFHPHPHHYQQTGTSIDLKLLDSTTHRHSFMTFTLPLIGEIFDI